MNTLLSVHPKVILVNAKPVRGDLEAAPVGIYDVIRDDVRELSTVKPVDRVFVERTETGYRGVLYSHDRPYIFVLNGNGFTAKPLDDNDVAVLSFCTKLEEGERALTARFDADRADQEQLTFNEDLGSRPTSTEDATVIAEDPYAAQTRMCGPQGADPMERVPGDYRQSLGLQRTLAKEESSICGGGIVMNEAGKVLLIKPKDGYGGYDWTFPKGYPATYENNIETALREVREETGLPCEIERKLGRFAHNDGGMCDYYVMAPRSEKIEVDGVEVEAAKFVTLIEALELLNDDVDVKILAQANQLIPTLIIKGGHTGTMIALHLPKKIAKRIAISGGESPDDMHITLAYLGKGLTEKQKKAAATVIRKFANIAGQIKATLGGVGRFSASESSEGKDVVYLSVDSPDITRLHPQLTKLLGDVGLKSGSDHGFTPHVTLTFIDKTDKTPLERFEPITINFDSVALSIGGKRMAVPFKKAVLVKALPKMSDDQRDASSKKVGTRTIGASSKKLGSGGQVRYNYPGEQKPGAPSGEASGDQSGDAPQQGQKEDAELPHPDLPSPEPDQAPIAADHPDKPDPNDPRAPDPTKPQTPSHTINVAELCTALNIQRAVLQQIVAKMQKQYGAKARQKFIAFMGTHLAEFVESHGLDGDYFGLLFDVLTGKVPDGQLTPAAGASNPSKPVAQ